MSHNHMIILMVLAITASGCASTRPSADKASLLAPIAIRLGESGAELSPVKVQPGQAFTPPRCCPPLELRNLNGDVVMKYDISVSEQYFAVPAGQYVLVGHDPAGKEYSRTIEVTENQR